jgi:hypothetical protein
MTDEGIEERLYSLLPAIFRIRDAAEGQPLRALLAILERELSALRRDTHGMYDDWFIETCREWVVPYLGDLMGVELVRSIAAEGLTQRAYVANALRYRRRKGTAAVLEQLARDITGWPARAVEYFERIATTQHVQHVRLAAPATLSLRGAASLALLDGPFGREGHTVDVRSIERGRGRYNIPNVGVHLWRLRAYPLQRVEARPYEGAGVDAGRFHFDPLGRGGALYNRPRAETDIVHLAEERDVPARLRRRALYDELQGPIPTDGWFGAQPVLRVFRVDGALVREIAPPELQVCHLEVEPEDPTRDWRRPSRAGEVAVDPDSGRLAFPAPAVERTPDAVLVDFAYAFSADLGSGPYDRQDTLSDRIELAPGTSPQSFQCGVSKDFAAVGEEQIDATLSAAIDAWNIDALAAYRAGESIERVIVIMDSRSYVESLTGARGRCVVLPPGSHLSIVAARWPEQVDPNTGQRKRVAGQLDPSGVRPHLRGDLEVLGLGDSRAGLAGGRLELDGLLLEGALRVLPGELGALSVRHCTLVPGHGGLLVSSTEQLADVPAPAPFADRSLRALASNAGLRLELVRSIVAGITVTGSLDQIALRDCIVDRDGARLSPNARTVQSLSNSPLADALRAAASAHPSITPAQVTALLAPVADVTITWTAREHELSLVADAADVHMATSTAFGGVSARTLHGSESIFAELVFVRVVQEGCLRYSYAPLDARTPQRFRCQPDLALELARSRARDRGHELTASEQARLLASVRPLFGSRTFGHPAYAQLARATADELYTGAEDGSEMGAFHLLQQAHRESNLRAALEQHLRFGLEAGLFFVT